jgi:hypothetical protein
LIAQILPAIWFHYRAAQVSESDLANMLAILQLDWYMAIVLDFQSNIQYIARIDISSPEKGGPHPIENRV